jgi:hypothetical protein
MSFFVVKFFWILILLVAFIIWVLVEIISRSSIPPGFQSALIFIIPLIISAIWGRINNPNIEFITLFKLPLLLFRKDKRLRISFSYLIRVQVGNDYMLVRSAKKNEPNLRTKYQPIGGVYQMINKEVVSKRLGFLDDKMAKSDPKDLRKMLKNPFKIFPVLQWFSQREEIEAAPFRELNGIDSTILEEIVFEKIGEKRQRVKWSQWNEVYEYKIFDIYRAALTQKQEEYLESLKTQNIDELGFFEAGFIEQYLDKEFAPNSGIAEHTRHILNGY